jgi:hypothetical protein
MRVLVVDKKFINLKRNIPLLHTIRRLVPFVFRLSSMSLMDVAEKEKKRCGLSHGVTLGSQENCPCNCIIKMYICFFSILRSTNKDH